MCLPLSARLAVYGESHTLEGCLKLVEEGITEHLGELPLPLPTTEVPATHGVGVGLFVMHVCWRLP